MTEIRNDNIPTHISIVISVYNEEAVIKTFYSELTKQIDSIEDIDFEIIFVDDGSQDATPILLNEIFNLDKRVKVIHFSRNFGHEAAMLAGIENSYGDMVICMDSDLQHPPSKIPEILEKFKEGYEVINMVRSQREDASFIGRLTSKYFYKILNKISDFKFEPNASDFFAISKRVAQIVVTQFKDRNRFIRGYIQQIGFKKTTILYEAPKRIAGVSKYNFYKLLIFSISVLVANSKAPLRFSIFISFAFVVFSIVVALYSIIMKIIGNPFSGYTTIIVFLSLAFGLLFLVIGILGEYIGNIYQEIKARPHYIIEKVLAHEPE
ncbi:MAG: glycosyltransferase family 2 protein [Bacteroidales bacterium]